MDSENRDPQELAAMRSQQLADLGSQRAYHIRNVQKERQEPVDSKALATARRANHSGTNEARWAAEPENRSALSDWNNFVKTVDENADPNDGKTGQAHRARVSVALQANQARRQFPAALHGVRIAGAGRGGARADQPSIRPNLVALNGGIVVAARPLANAGRGHVPQPVNDLQRKQQLELAKTLAAEFRKPRHRGAPSSISGKRSRTPSKTQGVKKVKPIPLPSATPRMKILVPPMIDSENFLNRFLGTSGLGKSLASPADRRAGPTEKSDKVETANTIKVPMESPATEVTINHNASHQTFQLNRNSEAQIDSLRTMRRAGQEQLGNLPKKFEQLGLHGSESGRLVAIEEGHGGPKTAKDENVVAAEKTINMLSAPNSSPPSISPVYSNSSNDAVDVQNTAIRHLPMRPSMKEYTRRLYQLAESVAPVRSASSGTSAGMSNGKTKEVSPEPGNTLESAAELRIGNYALKNDASLLRVKHKTKAAPSGAGISPGVVQSTRVSKALEKKVLQSPLPRLGSYEVLPRKSPSETSIQKTSKRAAKKAARQTAERVDTGASRKFHAASEQSNQQADKLSDAPVVIHGLDLPSKVASPVEHAKKIKNRRTGPVPSGLEWLVDALNAEKQKKEDSEAKQSFLHVDFSGATNNSVPDPVKEVTPFVSFKVAKNPPKQAEVITAPVKVIPLSEDLRLQESFIDPKAKSKGQYHSPEVNKTHSGPEISLINALSGGVMNQFAPSSPTASPVVLAPSIARPPKPMLGGSIFAVQGRSSVQQVTAIVDVSAADDSSTGFERIRKEAQLAQAAMPIPSIQLPCHATTRKPYNQVPTGQRPRPPGLDILLNNNQPAGSPETSQKKLSAAPSVSSSLGPSSQPVASADRSLQTRENRTESVYTQSHSNYATPGAGYAGIISSSNATRNPLSEPQNMNESDFSAKGDADNAPEVSRGRRRHR